MSAHSLDSNFIRNSVESAIRIGLLLIVVVWSFHIVAPFILPILWGAILAVALMPLARKLAGLLGGRERLAINLIVLIGVLLLVVPFYLLTESLVASFRELSGALQSGNIDIPSPSQRIVELPLVGAQIAEVWMLAETNLEAALGQMRPELVEVGRWIAGKAVGVLLAVLIFTVSIVIAGAFMKRADSMVAATQAFAVRCVGQKGVEWAKLSADTINSVVAGVLGVAVIQATLLAIGMFWLDVPFAGLWTLIALFFAIIQVPNVILMIPIIGYVFSVHDTTPAVIFAIWSLFAATSNLWLGPILMSRGVNVPMMIVFLGAIGGMIFQGVIGLFVGAVVLALGYSLYKEWLSADSQ